MLVEAAQPANVDTVMIDGRVRQTGRPADESSTSATSSMSAARASTDVRRRSGWTWPSQP